MQSKNRRRFGTLQATFGRDFGTIGWYFGCSGTSWRPFRHALGTLLAKCAKGKKNNPKREPSWRSPGRILFLRGSILRCFFVYFAKNRFFLRDVFQIGFFIDFGALRDPLGLQKTSKTIVALHENKVLQKSKKVPSGSNFDLVLRRFWSTFLYFL